MFASSPPLACPHCASPGRPESAGWRCSACGRVCPGDHGWLEFLAGELGWRTPAQASNSLPPTALGYELWRRRSLSLLSGQHFPLASELHLMTLLAPASGWVVDLGCSTALYARHLASCPDVEGVIALDIAGPMLDVARQRLDEEPPAQPVVLVRARAQELPIQSASIGGVYIGGSLNEMGETAAVYAECARVLAPGGRLFVMYVQPATSLAGRVAQFAARGGGIAVFDRHDLDHYARQAGLEPVAAEGYGSVGFHVAVAA